MPIPTVATGTLGGICAIESRASSPFKAAFTGTPMTGLVVLEATTPGRAALRPAIAMKTSADVSATSLSTLSGFLWADATSLRKATPKALSTSSAFFTISSSLLLPAIISTFSMKVI